MAQIDLGKATHSSASPPAQAATPPNPQSATRNPQSTESHPLTSPPPRQPVSTTQAIAGTAMLLGLLLIAWFIRHKLTRRQPAPVHDTELLRDIRELTDRLATELDAKADRLEKLLRAADDRINVLEANAKETRVIEPKPEPRRASPYDTTHRDVYDLADRGLSVLQIAQKLDRPTGQVELILNLRKGTVPL